MMEQEKHDIESSLTSVSAVESARLVPVSSLKTLLNLDWWRHAVKFALIFAPQCFLPALLYIAGITIVAASIAFYVSALQQNPDITSLLKAGMCSLAAAILAPAAIFWSFAAWLIRFSAFALSFDQARISELHGIVLSRQQIAQIQLDALAQARERKIFMAQFWSIYSMYLIVPCGAFMIAFFLQAISMMQSQLLSIMMFTLPPWLRFVSLALCVVLGIYLTSATSIGVYLSAVTEKSPVETANNSIALSFKYFLPASVITGVSMFLYVLVTSPQELVHLFKPENIANINPLNFYLEELWRAIANTVVWPLSLAPICEYLRDRKN